MFTKLGRGGITGLEATLFLSSLCPPLVEATPEAGNVSPPPPLLSQGFRGVAMNCYSLVPDPLLAAQ